MKLEQTPAELYVSLRFFPQALLAGFSFRTGEHKAFAVRKIAATPEKVPILHKNVPGNVPGTFFGKKNSIVEVPAVRSWRFPPFERAMIHRVSELVFESFGPPKRWANHEHLLNYQ